MNRMRAMPCAVFFATFLWIQKNIRTFATAISKQKKIMATLVLQIPDESLVQKVKQACKMIVGVASVKVQKPAKQKTRIYDPETGEYMNDRAVRDIEQALDDAKHGRLTTYNSVDDFFKEMGL